MNGLILNEIGEGKPKNKWAGLEFFPYIEFYNILFYSNRILEYNLRHAMGWIHTLKSLCSAPKNVIMFGDKIFKEVIKLNEVFRVGPDPVLLVPL